MSKDKIIYNFNYNKDRYVLGKHYIEVFGEELRRLKRTCEIQSSFKYAKTLYLWTEKGALLHAKSLNTDKETKPVPVDTVPVVSRQKDKKLPQIDNPIGVLKLLLQVAEDNGIGVSSYPFKTFESVLKNGNIGIRTGVGAVSCVYPLSEWGFD